MEFINTKLACKFSVPDKPTVRQQLAYYSEAGLARGKELFERYWLGARTLISDWQCDIFQPDANLDEATDTRIAELMLWAGIQVKQYMDGLDNVPKN